MARFTELQTLLSDFERGARTPTTIEESLAHDIVKMAGSELRRLARRAYRRGSRESLTLIQAEFLRRRGTSLATAA